MSDTVQQIKEKLNIIDVISPYVELHKAGKNFKGKSPFTAEKTPSFYVSPDRGMYYCFSTSQGGDIFNFVQVMEGVDFKEALKILAHKAGVELVPEDPKKKSQRERYYAALEAATVFYDEKLEKEKAALEYLKKRGVKNETVSKWRIGFAPGPPKYGWRETKDYLEKKGFTKDELLKTGLIKSAEGGKEPFDVFRDRIVFPLFDSSGKVVAFSGRILSKESEAPKYVNSPETELYKKSELLYGYDKAKNGIRNLDFSLIVEGQFDVVMCHQAGYSNTVAVSGTALTIHHVQLLERLSEKVVLALDADRAGIAAMKKAADVMLRRGLDVKVAELPIGKDPADIIQRDPVEFKNIVGHSVHVIEFLLHVLKREVADSRSFKLKAREEVLPFILLLPSRIDQEHFISMVADVIDTTVDAVRYELDRLRERMESSETYTPAREIKSVDETQKEERVTAENHQNIYLYLMASLQVVNKKLSAKLAAEIEKVTKILKLSEPDSSELAKVTFVLEQEFAKVPALSVAEEVVSKLNLLKKSLLKKRLSEFRLQIKEMETTGEDDMVIELLKKSQEFEKLLREPAYKSEDFMPSKD